MRRLVAALLVVLALGAAAPAAGAATKVPWRQCGSLTVASARLAIASWRVQRMGCAFGLELVLHARRASGGREGERLLGDGFRCRVDRVEAGTWYWCGRGDGRAVLARLVVF
jgi:hypothetical protein